MGNITYGRDEVVRLISSWYKIMEVWDDNKSHEINSKYFQSIFQSSRQLMQLSDEIHTIVNDLASEAESA